jgi:hypothetical protein
MSNKEYVKMVELTDRVLAVPHSEIKAKLEAEKLAKKRKKSRRAAHSL